MPKIILRGYRGETTLERFKRAQKRYAQNLVALQKSHQIGKLGDWSYIKGLRYLTRRISDCDSMRSSFRLVSSHCHCPECSGIMVVHIDGRPGSAAVEICKCRHCGRECNHCGGR
jgi:hypothetical protein